MSTELVTRLEGGVGYLTAGLVALAPLAIGGTPWPIQLALSGGALGLLLTLALLRVRRGLPLPWVTWLPLLLVVVGLAQLMPLSVELLEALSPKAAELRRLSLADLGLYAGARHPLSLDPPATWLALFHQAGFAALVLVGAALDQYRTRLLGGLMAAAGLVSLVGMAQWAGKADKIFFVYDSFDRSRMEGFFSTFVNNNTLAGLCVLGAVLSLGLLSRPQTPTARHLTLLSGGLAGTSVILSGSRGGQAALALGVLVFAAQAFARPRGSLETARKRARLISLMAIVVTAVGVTLAVLTLPDWGATAWDQPDADGKVAAWLELGPYLKDFAWVGSGRGTFRHVFPHYQSLTVSGVISHPENIALQLCTEWGILVGGLTLLWGLATWFKLSACIGRHPQPAHWSLMAALAAVGAQQLLDFGLETPGLSFPVAVGLGVAIADCRRHRGDKPRSWTAWPVAAAAAGLLISLTVVGPGLLERRARVAIKALSQVPLAELESRAATVVQEHPAEPHLPFVVAARLQQEQPRPPLPRVLRWLNRAFFLSPSDGRAHHLAARALVSAAGRGSDARLLSQAALEYGLALERMPWAEAALIAEMVTVITSPERLVQALPATSRARRRLGNTLLQRGLPERARAAMEHLLSQSPDDPDAWQLKGQACFRLNDDPCVQSAAAWLDGHEQRALAKALEAQLAIRRGDVAQARRSLALGEAQGLRDPAFLRTAVEVYGRARDFVAADQAFERLWRLVGTEPRRAAAALALKAEVERLKGDLARAQETLREAARLDPAGPYERMRKRLTPGEPIPHSGHDGAD